MAFSGCLVFGYSILCVGQEYPCTEQSTSFQAVEASH